MPPYLLDCMLLMAVALLSAKRLGRAMGALLLGLCLLYLVLNLRYMACGSRKPVAPINR
jgi:hypothetical protein